MTVEVPLGYGPDGAKYGNECLRCAEPETIAADREAAKHVDAGPETCTQCGDHVGHLMFDGVCANCRNENSRVATVQLD